MPLFRILIPALLGLVLFGGAARAQTAQAGATAAEPSNPLFAVVYRAGPSWVAGQEMAAQPGIRDHFFYIRDVHGRGVILAAGPWGDDGGLILLRVEDMAAARAVMEADPAVISGLFVGEVRAFAPRFTTDAPIH